MPPVHGETERARELHRVTQRQSFNKRVFQVGQILCNMNPYARN